VIGVVLAGGAARRFGSDKALARTDGVPMARRVADVLRDAGLRPVVVARHERPELGVETWIEADGPRHPAWGLAAALARAGGEAVFVAPCDVPGLTVDTVRVLRAARAVATACPLVGWWPAGSEAWLLRGAHAGTPMRALADACCRWLDVGAIVNCNTPPGVAHAPSS
jgi:molybdopterin-guanine dinucleotide biosynthesis protein A